MPNASPPPECLDILYQSFRAILADNARRRGEVLALGIDNPELARLVGSDLEWPSPVAHAVGHAAVAFMLNHGSAPATAAQALAYAVRYCDSPPEATLLATVALAGAETWGLPWWSASRDRRVGSYTRADATVWKRAGVAKEVAGTRRGWMIIQHPYVEAHSLTLLGRGGLPGRRCDFAMASFTAPPGESEVVWDHRRQVIVEVDGVKGHDAAVDALVSSDLQLRGFLVARIPASAVQASLRGAANLILQMLSPLKHEPSIVDFMPPTEEGLRRLLRAPGIGGHGAYDLGAPSQM